MIEARIVMFGPTPDKHKDGCWCCGDTWDLGVGNRGWCDKCNHDRGPCCMRELWEDDEERDTI